MQLNAPFLISSRLLPALKVGDCTISLELGGSDYEGRTIGVAYFDFDDGREYSDDSLRSGRFGTPSVQRMFGSLLSFMSACGEGVSCSGENADLFCEELAEFCAEHEEELSTLACELEETPNLISE